MGGGESRVGRYIKNGTAAEEERDWHRVSYLKLAGLLDKAYLRRHIEKMMRILISEVVKEEANEGMRLKRQSEYRNNLHTNYIQGAGKLITHLYTFMSSLLINQASLLTLRCETQDYPAAAKPLCANWQFSVKLAVVGPRGINKLGPVAALRRRRRRAIALVDAVKRDGDAMLATINNAPPMQVRICSGEYLARWEDDWAADAKECGAARVNYQTAVEVEKELATGNKDSGGKRNDDGGAGAAETARTARTTTRGQKTGREPEPARTCRFVCGRSGCCSIASASRVCKRRTCRLRASSCSRTRR